MTVALHEPVAAAEQLIGVRGVQVQPFRLPIGAVHPAHVGPLFPIETEPAQVLENPDLGFLGRSLDIGILDAQDERTVLAVREQPVEECRARVTHMKVAGGTWSESNSHYGFFGAV